MRIQRAKAHLSNGDIVELKIQTEDIADWLDTVLINGIKTGDKYIPHHSIVYILIEPEENDIVIDEQDNIKEQNLEGGVN